MAKIYRCQMPERDTIDRSYLADSHKEAAEKCAAEWCHKQVEYIENYVEVQDASGEAKAFTVDVVSTPEFVATPAP